MGVALVTGASAGLGTEFAKLFARDGHSVILVARRKDRLESLAHELIKLSPDAEKPISTWVIDIDLGKPGAGEKLFKQVEALGLSVEFLVNNAGFGSIGEFAELPLPRELQMIDLNCRTLVELTHLFLPSMLMKKTGRILNVGSMAGFQPGPYMATYFATKAFVNSFSEALNEELIKTGVTCTVLAPGPVATEFSQAAGTHPSNAFSNSGVVAKAGEVAKLGYDAMMAGKSMAVNGTMNKLLIQALRVSPRVAVRKAVAQFNKP
jgi:uncharacterized protein